MDLALLAVTALGFIGVFLMLPREKATLSRIGGLIGIMALGGLFLLLVRQAVATERVEDRLTVQTPLYMLRHGTGVLSQGLGVRAVQGQNDFRITSSGGTFDVSLFGAKVIGDVMVRIHNASLNKTVLASISDNGHSLVLKDSGGVMGIEPLNQSEAAADLGLLAKPAGGVLVGDPIEPVTSNGAPSIFFYVFAAIMVLGSAGVVSHPRPVYAALYFVLVTLAGAGLFVMLLAEFMAIVLIIVYAGAILVTYVFVLMLASQGSASNEPPEYDRRASEPFWAVLVSFILLGTVLQALYPVASDQKPGDLGIRGARADQMMVDSVQGKGVLADGAQKPAPGNMQLLGVTLYGQYGFSLELAGVLLTIALVGAVVIARKNVDYSERPAGTGALPAE